MAFNFSRWYKRRFGKLPSTGDAYDLTFFKRRIRKLSDAELKRLEEESYSTIEEAAQPWADIMKAQQYQLRAERARRAGIPERKLHHPRQEMEPGGLAAWYEKTFEKPIPKADKRDWAGYQLHRAERRMDSRVAHERARMAREESTRLEGPLGPAPDLGRTDYLVDYGGGMTAPIESFGDEIAMLRDMSTRQLQTMMPNLEGAYKTAVERELSRRGVQLNQWGSNINRDISDELHLLHEGPAGPLPEMNFAAFGMSPGERVGWLRDLPDDKLQHEINLMRSLTGSKGWGDRAKRNLDLAMQEMERRRPKSAEVQAGTDMLRKLGFGTLLGAGAASVMPDESEASWARQSRKLFEQIMKKNVRAGHDYPNALRLTLDELRPSASSAASDWMETMNRHPEIDPDWIDKARKSLGFENAKTGQTYPYPHILDRRLRKQTWSSPPVNEPAKEKIIELLNQGQVEERLGDIAPSLAISKSGHYTGDVPVMIEPHPYSPGVFYPSTLNSHAGVKYQGSIGLDPDRLIAEAKLKGIPPEQQASGTLFHEAVHAMRAAKGRDFPTGLFNDYYSQPWELSARKAERGLLPKFLKGAAGPLFAAGAASVLSDDAEASPFTDKAQAYLKTIRRGRPKGLVTLQSQMPYLRRMAQKAVSQPYPGQEFPEIDQAWVDRAKDLITRKADRPEWLAVDELTDAKFRNKVYTDMPEPPLTRLDARLSRITPQDRIGFTNKSLGTYGELFPQLAVSRTGTSIADIPVVIDPARTSAAAAAVLTKGRPWVGQPTAQEQMLLNPSGFIHLGAEYNQSPEKVLQLFALHEGTHLMRSAKHRPSTHTLPYYDRPHELSARKAELGLGKRFLAGDKGPIFGGAIPFMGQALKGAAETVSPLPLDELVSFIRQSQDSDPVYEGIKSAIQPSIEAFQNPQQTLQDAGETAGGIGELLSAFTDMKPNVRRDELVRQLLESIKQNPGYALGAGAAMALPWNWRPRVPR